ncbi:MAG: hypothetical protein ACXWJW_13825 [Xanthobacteraceae bacterium]
MRCRELCSKGGNLVNALFDAADALTEMGSIAADCCFAMVTDHIMKLPTAEQNVERSAARERSWRVLLSCLKLKLC